MTSPTCLKIKQKRSKKANNFNIIKNIEKAQTGYKIPTIKHGKPKMFKQKQK